MLAEYGKLSYPFSPVKQIIVTQVLIACREFITIFEKLEQILTLFYVAPEYHIWYSIPDKQKCA